MKRTSGQPHSEMLKANQALRDSEKRLRLAQISAGAGVWDWDFATGKLNWSEELFQLLGLDPSKTEANFDTWRSVLHPDDRAVAEKRIATAIENHTSLASEYRIKLPSGEVRWIRALGNTTCDAGGKPERMSGICIDITDSKRAETALQANRQLFETVVNNMPAAVGIIRGSDLRLRLVNPGYQAIAPGKDMIGKTLDEIWPETGKNFGALCRQVLATGESHHVEDELNMICRHPGGPVESAYFSWSLHRIRLPGDEGWGILNLAMEITERKRAEQALNQSEAHFRVLAEALPQIVWTADADGNIEYFNRHWYEYTGKPQGFGEGWNWEQVVHSDDIALTLKKWQEALRSGELFQHENRTRRHDGVYRWFLIRAWPLRDTDGKITRWFGTNTDIHDVKAAEAALRQSREDLDRAQEVGQIGWWRLDTRRNILMWSDENHRIFGVPKGTPMTYETFLGTVHEDDRQYVDARWNAGLRGESYDIEHRILADGRVKWVREKAYLEFDNSGGLMGGFGITQDITDRKLAEQQVRELNETLEQRVAERTAKVRQQADQLRALASQLSQTEQRERKRLAKILHDHIQQLIVAAQLQLAWIKGDNDAERMQTAIQSIDGILHEALVASRSLTIDLSPPALHESGLAGGLNWLATRMAEKHRFIVNLRVDKRAEPATEEMRYLLFECARELLFNAAKHAGVSDAQMTLLQTQDGLIKLIVSDRGKGFDADMIKNRQPDEITFGLFSIQERLAHMGGRMELETAPGKGARITLTVPVGEAAASSELASEAAAQEPTRAEKKGISSRPNLCRILIVDDHRIMREGLTGLLQLQSGIEVIGEAADGPQAIELARSMKPDIVIMDVNLGAMSGVEATRRILAENPSIKVIGLSMHNDSHIALSMREAGATAYLTKGGPSGDLIAAIRSCVPTPK